MMRKVLKYICEFIKKPENKLPFFLVLIVTTIVGAIGTYLFDLLLNKNNQKEEILSGELCIICNEDSANVWVNKQYCGITYKNNIVSIGQFNPGTYLVEVIKPGFENHINSEVRITKGEKITLKVDLIELPKIDQERDPPPPPKMYTISIMIPIEFDQAKIIINSKKIIGHGSKDYLIPEGKHLLEIKANTQEGNYYIRKEIEVKEDKILIIMKNEFELLR